MVDQKINGEEEFEDIDLTFDEQKPDVKPKEEVESIDDLDFSSFEEDHHDVTDELHDEIKDKKLEPPVINLDPTPVVKPVAKQELEDLDIDLDTPEPPKIVSTVVDTEKNTEVPGDTIENIDLDLDEKPLPEVESPVEELVAPVVEEPVKEEPKKRGRKPKAQVEQVQTPPVIEPSRGNLILDPLFDLNKINPSRKYQTRAVERTPEQLKQFGEILKMQGQLEPIQIHKEGPEYFLVVGFGRYDALRMIGSQTIKVIIHENLSESDLIKLSTGTNENRLELTEWDKITAVGKFAKDHPEISKYSDDGSPSLCRIFGYNKSTIYAQIEQYNYFIEHEPFVLFFKTAVIPKFIYNLIYDAKEHIGDDEEKFVKFINDFKHLKQKDFASALAEFIANERIVKRIIEQENPTSNPNTDIDLGEKKERKSEIDKMVINLTENGPLHAKEDTEKIKKVSELLTEFSKHISSVEDTLKNLLAIDNAKQYIDNSRINTIGKKITNLSKLYLKIA